VEVAWADGRVQQREREAILKAAEDNGIAAGSVAHDLLESWLESKPGADLMDVWARCARAVATSLPPGSREALKTGLLARAEAVAEAAGGFLGLGDKVSDEERAILEQLERALS
jgi:hypothetical protein